MTFEELQVQLRRIAQRRIDAGTMSITLLSARTGYAPSHVSNWVHCKRGASVEMLAAVLGALSMALELVPAQTTPTPPTLPKPKP